MNPSIPSRVEEILDYSIELIYPIICLVLYELINLFIPLTQQEMRRTSKLVIRRLTDGGFLCYYIRNLKQIYNT